MPNGKPGDHPFADIVIHGLPVYSDVADELVRDVARLADEPTRRQLADRLFAQYNELNSPDIAAIVLELTILRDQLRSNAAERGWEVE